MFTLRPRISWFTFFLVMLWLGATFVYFGDTGKYADDYYVVGRLVDREGIDWSSHPWQMWPYFWRPLHLAHFWVMNTVFWNHEWIAHLELAVVHAAVCVLLYRLLVRMGSARGPAIAAALLFGTCPLVGEAIGWSSASCNAIGSLFMLIALELGRRFGSASCGESGEASPVASPARRPAGRIALEILLIAGVSFVTACFYEPAAAGLAVIPILVWLACPVAGGLRLRLRRTVLATMAAGVPCLLYVSLLVWTAPPGYRGAADTIGGVHSLPETLNKLARAVRHMLAGARGRDILLGSIEQGVAAAREHPVVLGILIASVVAGIFVVISGYRAGQMVALGGAVSGDVPPRSRGQLLLVGIGLFVASLVPFIAQHAHDIELRSIYVPLMGVAFLVAAVGNGLCRGMDKLSPRGREAFRAIAAGVVGIVAIAGQVGLVGMQTNFRNTARKDDVVAKQLAAIASHVEADTVLLILAAEHRGAATSHPTYNAVLHTALRDPWCATTFLRRAMNRSDVRLVSGVYGLRAPLPIDHLSLETLRYTGMGGKSRVILWADVVPVWIDTDARVHIVEGLSLRLLDGETPEVRPLAAERLARKLSGFAIETTAEIPNRIFLTERANRLTRIGVDAESSSTRSPPHGTGR